MRRVLEEFFEYDGRQLGKHALLAFVAEVPPASKRQYNFNRFDMLIDRENGEIVIEDILDTSPAGACQVPLSDFIAAIQAMPANAEPGARAYDHTSHDPCYRTARAKCVRGSSVTFGMMQRLSSFLAGAADRLLRSAVAVGLVFGAYLIATGSDLRTRSTGAPEFKTRAEGMALFAAAIAVVAQQRARHRHSAQSRAVMWLAIAASAAATLVYFLTK